MTKTHSEQTTQQSHAIVFHALTQPVMHACENMQDCSVAKVTKPKSITYENISRKYRLKTIDLGKQNNK